ncbi:MAG: response regulator [Spirochaetes bacterium]|nr:response regulator [Spirochaetota bacterium]
MVKERGKILVVDDDPDMVSAIRMSLESASYKVVDAGNGKEGIEKAKKERPDLIVMDLMMPEMDGFEACKRLKADPEVENIPILVLTAIGQQFSDTKYAKDMGLRLDSEDFITKPVDTEVLLERVAQLI